MDYLKQGGHRRYFGVLPPTDFGNFQKFAATYTTDIPESQWVEHDFFSRGNTTTDQNGDGSCTGHGNRNAFTYLWGMSGQPYLDFSPTFLYGLTNGNRDDGAVISNVVRKLQTVGICLASQVPELDIWSSDYPPQAFVTAKLYRLLEAWHIETISSFGTATQLRFPVVFGMRVGENLGDLDADGCIPTTPRGRIGGHCLSTDGRVKFAGDGRKLIGFVNSWGSSWGQEGHAFLDPNANLDTTIMDAYAMRGCSIANFEDLPDMA